ncbi:HIT family protein [Pediococcus claussenii]|uniref:Histidine triad (HIT) domain protein n=1 Tax=Pediococcus claussenii (strain ATCC BAA-344 / DSM 14800 / JCM 18046 / KCTC 3811 / LMG 21948 / P06) TaxID=701521 RepID=G8PDS9_PEDCP|nr:HIT family protein [Pediococcus claussenii]AEV95414.1 Histidine triad (HIT) domain protein [Pediococcus claussenii ATCC BAA-344]ANZ68944.1 histidine triad protein [Pediococcus claussenii]ANZ70760.1 histidine triad protein [Pediococcus claussenii]KRN19057.1 hypothetical protein IV79_GL001719 [Pediococcus claussenii]
MDENCIFCKIVAGIIPSYTVYEDDTVKAFLDLSQTTPGHTLVIPKKHIANIYEYNPDLAANIFSHIPMIATAIKNSDPKIKGLNIINNNGELAGQTIFHSHFHIIPRYSNSDTFSVNFTDNSHSYSEDELTTIQAQIKNTLEKSK